MKRVEKEEKIKIVEIEKNYEKYTFFYNDFFVVFRVKDLLKEKFYLLENVKFDAEVSGLIYFLNDALSENLKNKIREAYQNNEKVVLTPGEIMEIVKKANTNKEQLGWFLLHLTLKLKNRG